MPKDAPREEPSRALDGRNARLGVAVNFLASGATSVVNFFVGVALARWLLPSSKGRVDLILASAGLAGVVFGFSLGSGTTHQVAKGSVHVRKLVIVLAVVATLQGILAWATLALLQETPLIGAFVPADMLPGGIVVVAVLAFAGLASSYFIAILSGLHRFVAAACLGFLSRFAAGAAIVIAVWATLGDPAAGASTSVASSAVASVVAAVFALEWVMRIRSPAQYRVEFGEIVRFSRPCYLANLVQFLNYRMDVFFVAYFAGEQSLAFYMTAVSLGQMIWLPTQALATVLFPVFSSLGDDSLRSVKAAQASRIALALAIVIGLGLAGAAPWLVPMLFGRPFESSVPLLWLLLPGVVAFVLSNVLASYLAAIGKPTLNLVAATAGFAVTLALNVTLVPWLGAAGAAIASSASYFATTVVVIAFFRQQATKPVPLAQILFATGSDLKQMASLRRDRSKKEGPAQT